MYHLSDLRKYRRCPRLFALSAGQPRQDAPRYIRMEETLMDLIRERFGITEYFEGVRNDPKERFLEAFSQGEWFIRPRMEYGRIRANIPLLHRTEEGNDIYFTYMGLYPHAQDPIYYLGTKYVLEGNGIPLRHAHIIHFNAEYVREGELDLEQLFTVSDCFYNDRNNPSAKLDDWLKDTEINFEEILDAMESTQLPSPVRSSACTGRQKCMFYEQCFPQEAALPEDSILTLLSSAHKYEMYEEGITSLKDADSERTEGLASQYAQIMAARNGGLYADRKALEAWLSGITYPIAFIDFEWERYAIPPYDGMRPFDVLLFEYSIHVLQEDGTYTHDVFLSFHDDRKEFLESLLKQIPDAGSVVAYNASGAEVIRLQELGNQFPEYAQKLNDVIQRMRDLQEPFENGLVYDTRMRGSISLKTITGMLDPHLYSDLAINQGMNAVFEWRRLDLQEKSEDKDRIMQELKEYCGMDTWAMLVVYRWLRNISRDCTLA